MSINGKTIMTTSQFALVLYKISKIINEANFCLKDSELESLSEVIAKDKLLKDIKNGISGDSLTALELRKNIKRICDQEIDDIDAEVALNDGQSIYDIKYFYCGYDISELINPDLLVGEYIKNFKHKHIIKMIEGFQEKKIVLDYPMATNITMLRHHFKRYYGLFYNISVNQNHFVNRTKDRYLINEEYFPSEFKEINNEKQQIDKYCKLCNIEIILTHGNDTFSNQRILSRTNKEKLLYFVKNPEKKNISWMIWL